MLLVTSRETRRWILPKGHRMPGKTDWEAAAQEAVEEAGVQGVIGEHPIGAFDTVKTGRGGRTRPVRMAVYALEVSIELADWPERQQRERRWVAVPQALALVQEPGLKVVLRRFGRDHDAPRAWGAAPRP
ncbi:NUDIX hydrolase [Brevundimonas goettingensis]|uniref:NUDIX hydrolase n=1 Tax=Brevundimonas goettingensis TaxID=2774190 RepID=UPI0021F2290C|nr:NUDIX domain-containing protein [Brevundimonas goettingensis]